MIVNESDVAAVLVEPVVGTNGVTNSSAGVLSQAAEDLR